MSEPIQVIAMFFQNDEERTAAFTAAGLAPSEGALCWLREPARWEQFTSGAWVEWTP
jgi:hypothetical protein